MIEGLDTEGAVHCDLQAHRLLRQTLFIVIGLSALIFPALVYRDRGQGQTIKEAFTLLTMITITTWVFWKRFANISQVESDDGATLTLRLRGQTTHVPWSQVQSVEVNRPYAFWQVMIKYRRLGEAKVQTVRFLPPGWRKMTPAAAERLKAALEARCISE